MKQSAFQAEFVEFIPEALRDGVIYISQKYRTATHRCACGCGSEVVTPLDPTGWSLWTNRRAVTLHPSIGNWSLPCRAHYWIRNGKVVWAASMTTQHIQIGRAADQRMRDRYFARATAETRARIKVRPPVTSNPDRRELDWIERAWNALCAWFR